jgi:hypothetical protein
MDAKQLQNLEAGLCKAVRGRFGPILDIIPAYRT